MKRFNFLFNEAGDGGEGGGGGGESAAGAATLLSGGESAAAGGAAAGGETPAGAWGGLVQADGTFSEAWWEKDPDLKEHGAHFSKYKTVKDALEHTRSLQQLLGQKANAVIVPGPDSPKDVIEKFREKLGIPENPDGYKLTKPDNLPDGVAWDDGSVKEFSKLAHEIGITPQQAQKLLQFDLERAGKHSAASQEAIIATEKAELQKQSDLLSKEWGNGAEFTKNKELATRAAITAGYTVEQINSDPIFRNAGVVKALAKLGGLMSEDTLAKGAENGGYNDGYSKGMDIISNKDNPYYARYHNGDESVRAMVQGYLKTARK